MNDAERHLGVAAFLADPDWEPSDAELRELAERAWAAAEPTYAAARQELDRQLATAAAAAMSRIKSRPPDRQ